MSTPILCPCDSKKPYKQCCQPYHLGLDTPKTAEQLMRSRYSAYALELIDYIVNTWHASTCPQISSIQQASVTWIKLLINKSWNNQQTQEAFVDFDAFYEVNNTLERMHEVSRFIKTNGKWLYLDGKVS